MKVKEVTDDGWIFEAPYSGYGSDGSKPSIKRPVEGYLVRLPKEVGQLGHKGMDISCMHLNKCEKGIWW
jgi:hypothetical protein